MKKFIFVSLVLFTLAGLASSPFAQTKPRKTNARPEEAAKQETGGTNEPEPSKTPTKKNERPTGGTSAQTAAKTKFEPVFSYEFTQPEFVVSKIVITHDESGRGEISFMKKISDEEITDPLQVSPAALERINAALAALDFFNSEENYQYEKDYSHLGNIRIKIKRDGKERETKFNWTQNPEAKKLADEYRRISNQYIWIFDMKLARSNQPLETPKLMDVLDSYMRRNEISDPAQMLPFLKELSNDERLPLIARNHGARMVKEIEKAAAKSEK